MARDIHPVGYLEPIIPSSIFPACAPRSVGPELDKLGSLYEASSHGFKNYSSYEEHQALADAAMQREVEAGFAETGDVAGFTAKYGELVLSRIACIDSDKDGKQKVHLIHDLGRSAVNARIHLQERLVLPRLSDTISATLDLTETGYDTEHLSFLVAGFSDAFKMLRTHPRERQFLAGWALGTYVFRVLHGIILRSGYGAADMVSCGGKHDEDHAGSTRHGHIPYSVLHGRAPPRRRRYPVRARL